jgi:hypothetical protein
MNPHEGNGRVKLPVWFIVWLTGICIAMLAGWIDMRDRMTRVEVTVAEHIKQQSGPRIAWIPKNLLTDVAHADTVLVTDVPIIISPKVYAGGR